MKLKTLHKNKTVALGTILFSGSLASAAEPYKHEIKVNTYPWYLESWVWITAGLILGALVISALRGDIRIKRE